MYCVGIKKPVPGKVGGSLYPEKSASLHPYRARIKRQPACLRLSNVSIIDARLLELRPD
jgi:hypothetical protein